jgi:hypothetical protein
MSHHSSVISDAHERFTKEKKPGENISNEEKKVPRMLCDTSALHWVPHLDGPPQS